MREGAPGERVTPSASDARVTNIWYVGDSRLMVDVSRLFSSAAVELGTTAVVTHIADDDTLNYHRPRAHDVAIMLACPLTSTWSRARTLGARGPPPTRTTGSPWGAPWIREELREASDKENRSLRLSLTAVNTVLTHAAIVLWLFPEQMGSVTDDIAPSPWDLPEIRRWARREHLWRIAFNQCELGPGARQRPTGALVNARLHHHAIRWGWPRLRRRADGSWAYLGPLSLRCKCGGPHNSSTQAAPSSHPPVDIDALGTLATLLLKRSTQTEQRGPPTGRDSCGSHAVPALPLNSDSDATLEEEDFPASPPREHAQEQQMDMELCEMLDLNTELEDPPFKAYYYISTGPHLQQPLRVRAISHRRASTGPAGGCYAPTSDLVLATMTKALSVVGRVRRSGPSAVGPPRGVSAAGPRAHTQRIRT